MRQYGHERERVEGGAPRAISREEGAALTCSACGCRLTARESLRDSGAYGADAAWRHFPGMGVRDARGCRVECMDLPHRTLPPD
jgi:hypothetical protein